MKSLYKATALLAFLSLLPSARASLRGAPVFRLSVTGTNVQAGVLLNPGVKPISGKFNDKIVSEILRGVKDDFVGNFLNIDPSQTGSFYLIYVSRELWIIADNPNGVGGMQLTGQVDSIGNSIMFGTYSFMPQAPYTDPMARMCAVSKTTFAKGTFNPTKVTGTLYLSSTVTDDNMTLKFKTVGLVQ
ncbi:MAG: hypothetical protein JNJ88_19220 [Planctomycetes bacterium]|nr:hypothetical protein [Planctomycetota bacterium]